MIDIKYILKEGNSISITKINKHFATTNNSNNNITNKKPYIECHYIIHQYKKSYKIEV